jgi:hypothetical protein
MSSWDDANRAESFRNATLFHEKAMELTPSIQADQIDAWATKDLP